MYRVRTALRSHVEVLSKCARGSGAGVGGVELEARVAAMAGRVHGGCIDGGSRGINGSRSMWCMWQQARD